MREHNRLGITSVIDAGGGGQNFPDNYAAIAKLAADNQLTLRIGYELFAQAPGKELENYQRLVEDGEDRRGQRLLPHDRRRRIHLVCRGRPGELRQGLDPVAPPGVMENQFAEVVKYLAGSAGRSASTRPSTPPRARCSTCSSR